MHVKRSAGVSKGSSSFPFVITLLLFIGCLLYLHHHFLPHEVASTKFNLGKSSPSIVTICDDLGIPCYPPECNELEILRNATSISINELKVIAHLSALLEVVKRNAELQSDYSIHFQYFGDGLLHSSDTCASVLNISNNLVFLSEVLNDEGLFVGKVINCGWRTLRNIKYRYQTLLTLLHKAWNNTSSIVDVLRQLWDMRESIQKLVKEFQKQVQMARTEATKADRIILEIEEQVAGLKGFATSVSNFGRGYWKFAIPEPLSNVFDVLCRTTKACKRKVAWLDYLILRATQRESLLDGAKVRSAIESQNELGGDLRTLDLRLEVIQFWFVNATWKNEMDDSVNIETLFNQLEETLQNI